MVNENTEGIVYKKLKNAILTRQIYPNSQLVEEAIAKKLGVSRTPIRSALKQLAFEGLVEIIPRKGAFIVQPTKEEFIQLFSMRLFLEKEAARLAATNITDADIAAFKKLTCDEKESYLKRDFEAFLKTNYKMHMIIAEATKNKYYVKFIDELLGKSDIYLIFYDKFYSKSIEELNSVKEHKQILDAFRTKEPDKCAEVMGNHIQSIFENLDMNIIEPSSHFFT